MKGSFLLLELTGRVNLLTVYDFLILLPGHAHIKLSFNAAGWLLLCYTVATLINCLGT